MSGTNLNWKAAFWAGLIAGLAFVVLEMVLVGTVGGGSPWEPPRMIAAIALGPGVLQPPTSFDVQIVAVALAVHFTLSIVLAFIFAVLATSLRLTGAWMLMSGIVFGLAVYLVNFYGFTAIFPWFAMARNPISIGAHAVFGLSLGWVYQAMSVRGLSEG